jgi:hypothetical protein
MFPHPSRMMAGSPLGFRKPSNEKSYFNTSAAGIIDNRLSYTDLKKQ